MNLDNISFKSPPFLFCLTFALTKVFLSLPNAFYCASVIYLSSGGWRFARIFIKTLFRDLRALATLLGLKWKIWKFKQKKFNFGDIFAQTVAFRGREYTAMYQSNDKWTYGDLDNFSNRIANYFHEKGIKYQENIALFMEGQLKFVGIWLGAAKLGIATGLLNSNIRQQSLLSSIQQLTPKALVVGSSLIQAIKDVGISVDLPSEDVIIFSPDLGSEKPPSEWTNVVYERLEDIISNYPTNIPPRPQSPAPLSAKLIYVFTSGTTGLPKAAIITVARYWFICSATKYFSGMQCDDVVYVPLPLYHTAGGIIGVGQVLCHGSTIAIRSRFSASQFWSDCIRYKCTVVQYVGETCRYLLCQPEHPDDRAHQVRLAVGNGIRKQVWIDFVKRFNIPRIGEFYGATESNASVVNSENKVGAMGFTSQIAPFMYPVFLAKTDLDSGKLIRNPKTGFVETCKPFEVGQLIGNIKKHNPVNNFEGYINREDTLKKIASNVFKKGDSWFLSGDIMTQDEEGYFYFVDRLGDTFRWHGENVSTTEVENVVLKAIKFADCAVYGVEIPPNEGRAGMLVLANELDQNEAFDKLTTEANILSKLSTIFVNELPTYARPIFIRFSNKVDTTDTFKFRKLTLVKEGFNPNHSDDSIYYFDTKACVYRNLDKDVFQKILANQIHF